MSENTIVMTIATANEKSGVGFQPEAHDPANAEMNSPHAPRQSLGNFLRELAHELGNIAFPLQMVVELQHYGHQSPEELKSILLNQIAALQTINRRLQRVGRVFSSSGEPEFVGINPSEILLHAVAPHRAAALDKGVELQVTTLEHGPAVLADRDLLAHAVTELIDNAVRLTPAGGRIEATILVSDANVQFTVRDTGPGIPPEVSRSLFEPFIVGADRPRVGAGQIGCGLAVVRQIAELHGGGVELCHSSPEGTSIALSVPLETE